MNLKKLIVYQKSHALLSWYFDNFRKFHIIWLISDWSGCTKLPIHIIFWLLQEAHIKLSPYEASSIQRALWNQRENRWVIVLTVCGLEGVGAWARASLFNEKPFVLSNTVPANLVSKHWYLLPHNYARCIICPIIIILHTDLIRSTGLHTTSIFMCVGFWKSRRKFTHKSLTATTQFSDTCALCRLHSIVRSLS